MPDWLLLLVTLGAVASTTITTLELACGGRVLQVTGADTSNGATASRRTIYAYALDSVGGPPQFVGPTWFAVLASSVAAGSGVTATLTAGDGYVAVNGMPAYQMAAEGGEASADGVGAMWPYFLAALRRHLVLSLIHI